MAHEANSTRKGWFSGKFTQIPNAVFALLPDMSASAFTTYCVLAKHADKQGQCYPKIKKLAEERDVSHRAINRDLNELQDLGLLTRRRVRYMNQYTLLEPDTTGLAHLRSDKTGASEDPESAPDTTSQSRGKRQSRRTRSDKAVANMRTTRRELDTEELHVPPTAQGEMSAPSFSSPVDPFGDLDEQEAFWDEEPWEGGRIEEGGRENEEHDAHAVSTIHASYETAPESVAPPASYWTEEREARYEWTERYAADHLGWDSFLDRDDEYGRADGYAMDEWQDHFGASLDGLSRDVLQDRIDELAERDRHDWEWHEVIRSLRVPGRGPF